MTRIRFDDIQPVPPTPGQVEDAAVQLERDLLAVVREDIGMTEVLASVFARALVDGLRRRLGGQDLYIPAPDRSARDASIRREFTGANLQDIMRRYNLSRTRVYEIVSVRGSDSLIATTSPAFPLETGRPCA